MSIGNLIRPHPVWDIREFFGAMGNVMLASAVGLNLLFLQSKGVDLAWWQIGLGYLSAIVTGLNGLLGFWRFVTTSTKPATALILAIASVFASLLCGFLAGFVAITMIGAWLA